MKLDLNWFSAATLPVLIRFPFFRSFPAEGPKLYCCEITPRKEGDLTLLPISTLQPHTLKMEFQYHQRHHMKMIDTILAKVLFLTHNKKIARKLLLEDASNKDGADYG